MTDNLPVVPLLIPEWAWPFRSLGVVASNNPDHRGELTAAKTAPFSFRLELNLRNSSTVSGKCTFEAYRSRSEIHGCRRASSTVIRSNGSMRSICRTRSLAWSLTNCHLELFKYSFPGNRYSSLVLQQRNGKKIRTAVAVSPNFFVKLAKKSQFGYQMTKVGSTEKVSDDADENCVLWINGFKGVRRNKSLLDRRWWRHSLWGNDAKLGLKSSSECVYNHHSKKNKLS